MVDFISIMRKVFLSESLNTKPRKIRDCSNRINNTIESNYDIKLKNYLHKLNNPRKYFMDSIIINDIIFIPYDIEKDIYLLVKVSNYSKEKSLVSGLVYSKGSGIDNDNVIVGEYIDAKLEVNDIVYRVYETNGIYLGMNL